jgi:hypothetical protein
MSYLSAIATVASEHQSVIEADLSRALVEQKAAAAAFEHASRRVSFLRTLVDNLEEESPREVDDARSDQMQLAEAMHVVLKETGKLKATPLIAEIGRRGLYKTRKGGPPSSQQLHNRARSRPDLIGKDGSYFYAK